MRTYANIDICVKETFWHYKVTFAHFKPNLNFVTFSEVRAIVRKRRHFLDVSYL